MRRYFLPILLAVGLAAGCQGPNAISGFNDAAGSAYLAIGSASDLLYTLCRNEEPGGPCMSGTISTEDANRAADVLRQSLATVTTARRLYTQEGDSGAAMTKLGEARRLVLVAETILRTSDADDESVLFNSRGERVDEGAADDADISVLRDRE